MFAISVRDVAAHLNDAVHKFSAGVCSSQNLRVLHVFFLLKTECHCALSENGCNMSHFTCLNFIVFFVILLSLLVNLLTAIIIMQTLYKTLVW